MKIKDSIMEDIIIIALMWWFFFSIKCVAYTIWYIIWFLVGILK